MKNNSLIAFVLAATFIAATAFFLFGLYSGAKRNILFRATQFILDSVLVVSEETPNLLNIGEPVHFLQPSKHQGAGVTNNKLPKENNDLILLSGFFGNQNSLRLINRRGRILAQWPVAFSELFPWPDYLEHPPKTDRNIDIHGATINPDGSVIFNFEYAGTAQLDRCGSIEWTLREATHHSVEKSESGGYWIPGRRLSTDEDFELMRPFSEFDPEKSLKIDTVLKVGDGGQIEREFALPHLLIESGFLPQLTATGRIYEFGKSWDREVVHLNKIDELSEKNATAFPQFEAGDLLLSLRDYNLLLVIDEHGTQIKWHQFGPWLRQHDPEFGKDGRILLFNNNSFRTLLDTSGQVRGDAARVSNIMSLDPQTGRIGIKYGGIPGQELLSVIRGKVQAYGAGLVVSEFEAGRVFQTDAEGEIVWEYINRYDEERVLEMTEGRVFPSDYFTVTDWSCP